MRLFIPYVYGMLEPETAAFGQRHDARFVDLTDDPTGYWRLFARLWETQQPFAICEHDIVPTDAQYRELRECAAAWCAFGYERLGAVTYSLGFTKFDPASLAPQLRIDLPNMTQESREKFAAYGIPPSVDSGIDWRVVDGTVWTFLQARGYNPHRHDSLVEHRRERREGDTP